MGTLKVIFSSVKAKSFFLILHFQKSAQLFFLFSGKTFQMPGGS